ncbi:MAG: replicative DNA helicase [Candidatus Woesearchaeota archaeon]
MKKKFFKQKPIEVSTENIILPKNEEIEEYILGCMILDFNCQKTGIFKLKSNFFFNDINKEIFNSMLMLYQDNKPIDYFTIYDYLKKKNEKMIDDAGGLYFLSCYTNNISTTEEFEKYIYLVKELYLKREFIKTYLYKVSELGQSEYDVFDIIAETNNITNSLLNEVIVKDFCSVSEFNKEYLKKLYDLLQQEKNHGVLSGITNIDRVLNGFQEGDLIIIAGRPSMGKTAFAVSLILNIGYKQKIPCAFFSLEMTKEQIISRIYSQLSDIDVSKIVKKMLTYEEFNVMYESVKDLSNSNIYIDDTPSMNLIELKSKCVKLVENNGVKIIFIDYLQLMKSGIYKDTREQEVAEISRGLKSLAKQLNVPIVALSQLSRMVETRHDKKPNLSDLRESGQIEQDADVVMFCYRPEYYNIQEYNIENKTINTDGLFMLLVSKHRNGQVGEIPLKFINYKAKIENYNYFEIFNNEINEINTEKNEINLDSSVVFNSISDANKFNENFI